MKNETVGILQMVLASLLSAVLAVLVRFGGALGASNLAFIRVTLSAFFIYVIFSLIRKQKLDHLKQEKKKMIFFGAIHAFTILSYFFSILLLSISIATLLLATLSCWVVIFSHFILKEKIKKITIVALVIALSGMVVLLSPQDLSIAGNVLGVFLGLLAGMLGGLAYTLSKTFKTYNKISLAFWQNVISIPFTIPLLLIAPMVFTPTSAVAAILLGITGAVAFVALYSGLGKIAGQKAGVLNLLNAPFAIILAFIVFGETLTLNQMVGGAMIIVAAFLISR